MAKKDIHDIRVDFIEAIGRTDNLKVLRSISSSMNTYDYKFDLSLAEINKILNEGMKKVKELLGESVNDFYPLTEIANTSVSSYFIKIQKGYEEIKATEKARVNLDKNRTECRKKIHTYKEKGKLDKVKEFEERLYAMTYPKDSKEKTDNLLKNLDSALINQMIGVEQYTKTKREINRIVKIADSTKKVMDLINPDEENDPKGSVEARELYYKVQKNIRIFLCYLFFERDSKVADSPNRFLCTFDGEMKIDFEHMLLMYNYLKDKKYENLKEIEGVLYYVALERFYFDITPFMHKTIKGIYLKENPTEFYSEKFEGYTRGYIPSYLVPKGYRGYVFEPNCLNQQSFISAINKDELSIDSMVQKYKEAQQEMKGKENGILFSFLSKELENKLLPYLITSDFPLQEMDGEYKDYLLNEFSERRRNFGGSESFEVMTNMYMRVVKPYCLEVLGSYVRTFCHKLALLKDKSAVYIYYVSPQRIAIAVREDVTDKDLKEIFEPQFLKTLKRVQKPKLSDIVCGEYL